ncbi:hypothetical protein D187_009618 [Cystobacter fuscus DSM 2262]|uniref:Uncharacterized protein n=1 Tax=Cystobacter fuscus (strain ATCC 25194 / DSM 2262 / NBRC 100088 / M29) TaxID=1242864 RepID=S9NYP9_CYSF2|nr:hypothetical protein D187_009618 [Cystobacter fuscus DSM 2262]
MPIQRIRLIYEGGELKPKNVADLDAAVREEERRDENSMGLGLYRTKWPALDMALRLSFPPRPPRIEHHGQGEASLLLHRRGALPLIRGNGAHMGLSLPGDSRRGPQRG